MQNTRGEIIRCLHVRKIFRNILNKVNGNETKRGEDVILFLNNLPKVMKGVSQESS